MLVTDTFIFWNNFPETICSTFPRKMSESFTASFLPKYQMFSGALFQIFVVLVSLYLFWRLFNFHFPGTKEKRIEHKSKTKAIQILYDGGDNPQTEYVLVVSVFVMFHSTGGTDHLAPSIVAVHGLASNPDTTWNYRDSEGAPPHWLRDFLPKEGLNARIIAFNYNSEWKRNALSKSLADHGNDLLIQLDETRLKPEVGKPPECHKNVSNDALYKRKRIGASCLLVIALAESSLSRYVEHGIESQQAKSKQAIFNSLHSGGDFEKNVTDKAKGFVFLGTPHKGSSFTF